MTKSTKAGAAASASNEADAVAFADHPVVLAGLQFAAALAAVARFPHQPAPPSLTDRVAETQKALTEAIAGAPPVAAPAEGAGGGDLDKVWETFESLDKALDDRFKALEARATEQIEAMKAEILDQVRDAAARQGPGGDQA